MRCIGLTGGAGSGKTTVLRLLVERGATGIDADTIAREVVQPGRPALAEIVDRFGPGVLLPDGSLDRHALAAIAFADTTQRLALEGIMHPRIFATIRGRLEAARLRGEGVTIADIPLLLEPRVEVHGDLPLDGVLVVDVPVPVQRARLIARDALSEVEARRRLDAQMDRADRRARATWIIDNGGPMEATIAQLDRWWAVAAVGALVTAPAP